MFFMLQPPVKKCLKTYDRRYKEKDRRDSELNMMRKTRSVCPVCMKTIDAQIIDRTGKVYMEKKCTEHGSFSLLISENTSDYKHLSEYYFYFMPLAIEQREYYLNATTQCSINCPVCYLKYCDQVDELSLVRVNEGAQMENVKRFTFSHGEPTSCKQMFEMIKILKQAGKIVNMHTNAIKIADYSYACRLKSSGIDHVSVQFDGFSKRIYRDIRGQSLLGIKLKALKNLKNLSIPVTLNPTIAKGINEQEIGRIFDYAVLATNIKDVSFITYSHYEPTPENSNNYIMPDELLKYMEEHTRGKVSRKNIIKFQRLFYAYISVFKKRKCFYYYHFLVVRFGKGYLPINEFIDLDRANCFLAIFKKKKKKLTRLCLIGILCFSLKPQAVMLFIQGLMIFLRGGYPRKPGRFLSLTFASICDPYKYDEDIAANCGQGIVNKEDIYDSYGTYLMDQMKKSERRR